MIKTAVVYRQTLRVGVFNSLRGGGFVPVTVLSSRGIGCTPPTGCSGKKKGATSGLRSANPQSGGYGVWRPGLSSFVGRRRQVRGRAGAGCLRSLVPEEHFSRLLAARLCGCAVPCDVCGGASAPRSPVRGGRGSQRGAAGRCAGARRAPDRVQVGVGRSCADVGSTHATARVSPPLPPSVSRSSARPGRRMPLWAGARGPGAPGRLSRTMAGNGLQANQRSATTMPWLAQAALR